MTVDDAATQRRRAIVKTLLYVESGFGFILAAWMGYLAFVHDSKEMAPLLGVIALALLAAIGLFICGFAFARGKNFGRSPAILANLIILGVSSFQAQAHLWFIAIPLAVLSLTVLYLALRIVPE